MREVGKKRKAVHELKGESPLRAYCENGAKLSIQLYDSDSPDAEWAHLILILDNHEALGDISNLKLLTPEMWPLVSEAVKTIPLTGGTKTIQVQQKKEIIIHILPASYGRHNSSSRCHALRTFLKGQKAHLLSSRSDFLICSSSAEHAYAQALEISRHFPLFSSKTNKSSSAREAFVRIRAPHGNLDILNHLPHIADGIRHCQSLVDAPASILNVDAYVQECRQVALRTGCSIEVIKGYDLEDRGFGGIWGVGQAAEQLPVSPCKYTVAVIDS